MPGLEQRAENVAGKQWRDYPAQFEVRGLAGSQVELQGYASAYEQPYEMFDMFGPYTEVARAGMCAKTLSDGADVAYLANHEGMTLARTKAGSLQLSEDSTGLLTVATVNTQRSDARDLVLAIEDGAVDEMSFGFRMVRQQWSPDFDQRDLIEVNLHKGDVSAVNYGANPFTSVGAVQRAFRTRAAAEYHRAAVEVSQGQISPASAALLARALETLAVAEPKAERHATDTDEEQARALAALELLRLQHEHEKDRPRFIVGL